MSTTILRPLDAGVEDVAAAAQGLAERLPSPLQPLAELAYNYRWSWTPGGPELFEQIDPQRWVLCSTNPVRLLQEVSPATLECLAEDESFLERLSALSDEVQEDLSRPYREGAVSPEHPAAFFCAEYAVHQSLPVYSGGLGVLAGDILKAASDLALPMVAVGLMYRHGYFRQRIDQGGYQHEYWVDTDPARVPAARVLAKDGSPLRVPVPVCGRQVQCQMWRVNVGRVGLLLLDTDIPGNDPPDRFITSRLYVGDPQVRLAQYAVLGIGGVRVLRELGIDPAVVHLNEGHAAFASLELAHSEVLNGAESLDDAFAAARHKTVFTTHTPVPAGNDTYPAQQVKDMLGAASAQLGVDLDELVRRGRTSPDDEHEPFGVTQFALRSSRSANGVAARHGEVARQMWNGIWPGCPVQEVPITSVTNGEVAVEQQAHRPAEPGRDVHATGRPPRQRVLPTAGRRGRAALLLTPGRIAGPLAPDDPQVTDDLRPPFRRCPDGLELREPHLPRQRRTLAAAQRRRRRCRVPVKASETTQGRQPRSPPPGAMHKGVGAHQPRPSRGSSDPRPAAPQRLAHHAGTGTSRKAEHPQYSRKRATQIWSPTSAAGPPCMPKRPLGPPPGLDDTSWRL